MYDHILKPWMLVSQFLGKWLAFTEFRPIILSILSISMIHHSQSSNYLKSPYLCYENCHFDSLYQMISITTYYPDDIILWLIIWYASTKQQNAAIYVCYRFLYCLMKFTEVWTKDLQVSHLHFLNEQRKKINLKFTLLLQGWNFSMSSKMSVIKEIYVFSS